MSKKNHRRLKQYRFLRRELIKQLQEGRVLVASGEVPHQQGIIQIISISKKADNTVVVHIEHSEVSSWDDVLNEANYSFASCEEAFLWIESNYSWHWSQFHVPKYPPLA
jgi:hypothetical protein